MKGRRRWIAALIVVIGMAAPAGARASDCTLSGSGLEASATDTSFYQPATGTLKASMIFVDFSDHAFVPAEDPPDDPLSTDPIGHDLVDWAAGYFNDVSGGRMTLDVKMDDDWVRMPHPASFYNAPFPSFAAQRQFMLDAVNAADPTFDFSGRRILYVVSADTGGDLPNSPAFIAFNNEAIIADGASIRWGSSMGDDVRFPSPDYGSHILAHETGHTFGFPDLYSFGQDFAHTHLNAGAWDLMGSIVPGLGYSSWHRLKLGWLDPSQVVCVNDTGDATATLSPLASPGGTKMLISKTSPSTAYVAEVRAPVGVDTPMCDPGGVLIYKVDANAATGAQVDHGPIFVELAHPDDPGDPSSAAAACGALSNAPFGFGAGETSSFSGGGVTVQVLSGSPATGFSVRVTGPANPTPPTGPTGPTGPTDPVGPGANTKTGDIERKVHLDGRKRVVADLNCPNPATSCNGTLTLTLPDKTKPLTSGEYAVAPPGGEVILNLARKARKALREAFGTRDKTKAMATLDGPAGLVTQRVKLLR